MPVNPAPLQNEELPPRTAAWAVAATILLLPPLLLAPAWRLWGLSALEDGLLYYLPQRIWFAQSVAQGHWPLWQSAVYGGFPAFADPQMAVYYPPTWLFVFLPPQWASPLTICLHHSLAGWLMYRLCRGLGRRRGSALMAGIAFMFCGFMLSHREHMTMHHAAAWAPGVLWAWQRWASTRRIWHWAIAVLVVAMQLLAGHVQVSLMTAPVALALVVFAAPREKRIWLGCVAGFAAASIISAVQILPAMQLLAHSAERRILFYATYNSMMWRSLPLVLFPMILGQRTPNLYSVPWYVPSHQCEQTLYVTLVAVALAAGAILLCWRRDRQIRFWGWVSAITLVCALGRNAGVYCLVMLIPIFNVLHTPARWLLIVHIALIVIAAAGADELLGRSGASARAARVWRRSIPLGMTGAAGFIIAVFLLAWLLGYAPSPAALGPAIVIPPVLLAATLLLLVRLANRPNGKRALVLIGLVVIDAATVAPFLDVAKVGADAITHSPTAKALCEHGFDKHIHRVWIIPGDPYRSPRQCLMPDTNLFDGIATLNGYGPMLPTELQALFGFRPFGVTEQRAEWLCRPEQLAKFGVSHVVVRDKDLSHDMLKQRWDLLATVGDDIRIYKNRRAAPRWYATGRYRWTEEPNEILDALTTQPTTLPATDDVLLSGNPRPNAVAGPGQILATEIKDDSARFEVVSCAGTLLVWLNRFYPGWRATIGDEPATIYRADALGQAVFVPPGRHRVAFDFTPALLEWSRWVSLAGLIGLGAVLLAGRLSRRRRGGVAGPDA